MEYENFKHTELTKEIIKTAYYVHDSLGHGFLESVYEKALAKKLKENGFHVIVQYAVPVYFEGELVGDFRADMIVDNKVIIELKAVEGLHPIHETQLVNYLRATEIEVGLLFNFGEQLTFKRKVFSNSRKTNLKV